MKNVFPFLAVAALSLSLPQASAQAQEKLDDANLVAAAVPSKPEFSLDETATLHDCRYIKCDYNFLGRILIRNGKFHFGLRGEFVPGEGLQIESVESNSPAARAGLAPGMLITSLNGERPDDRAGFNRSFEEFDGVLKLSYLTAEAGSARDLQLDLRRDFVAPK